MGPQSVAVYTGSPFSGQDAGFAASEKLDSKIIGLVVG